MKNRMGPRTGSCGNQDVTGMVVDFSFSITTVWAQSDKKCLVLYSGGTSISISVEFEH